MVNNRYRALQQFFRWYVEEDEVEVSPMARMSPPAVPELLVPVVPEDDLKMLNASQDDSQRARRVGCLVAGWSGWGG